MGRKAIIYPTRLANAEDMSVDVTTGELEVDSTDNIGVHLVWTGTPTGLFFIQASIDGETFSDLSISPQPEATGSSGDWLVNLNQFPYRHIRIFYEAAGGSGALTVWAMARQNGGG